MVDIHARRELALHLRHLTNGRITDDEFDDWTDDLSAYSADNGLYAVRWEAQASLYDDFSETRFRGENRLGKSERREIARWILFLQNELKYEWQKESLLVRLRRAVSSRISWVQAPPLPQGDKDVWPFFRRADFEHALQEPKLLCGVK